MGHVSQIPVFVYVLIAVVILAVLGFVLLRGPKAPPGGYTSTRDPDDPVLGEPGAGGPSDGRTAAEEAGAPTGTTTRPLDTPESAGSRMARLRGRLAK